MPAVVQHLSSLVDGFDVASVAEMRVALDTSISSSDISFAGPGKSRDELQAAISSRIIVNMESFTELDTILRLGNELGETPRVAVRINPDFELKTSGMKMAGGAKQFGVDAEQAPDLLRKILAADLDFQGLHIFCGSQNLYAKALAEAQEKTFGLAYRLCDEVGCSLKTLNIGGGFGIPYFPGEQPLDLENTGNILEGMMEDVRLCLPDTRIVLELGRYIVGETGIYVCRIVDKKVSRGQIFLVTDGGLHHHLAASGNFGQILRKNYPVVIGNRMGQKERETVSIVGPLCTPLDLLADKMELPKADIGDYVVILQSGAYGYTASPTAFLSHPPPVEMLV